MVVACVIWALKASNEPKCSSIAAASSPSGLPPPSGDEVLPEQRVQHVAGQVERQVLLEADDGAEVVLVAGLGQLVEGVVQALDVGRVVLVVVELQDLGRVVRLERGVVVGQVGQGVGGRSWRASCAGDAS